MYCVGIDVAKNKHDVTIKNFATNDVVMDHISIGNNRTDFDYLYSLISHLDVDEVIIGCESTSYYHTHICNYFYSLGYKVVVINAHNIKLYRDFLGNKSRKDDKIDAYVIAEVLSLNKFTSYYNANSSNINELRKLSRLRERLSKKSSKTKVELSTAIEKVFPEFYQVFPSIHLKSVYELFCAVQLLKK